MLSINLLRSFAIIFRSIGEDCIPFGKACTSSQNSTASPPQNMERQNSSRQSSSLQNMDGENTPLLRVYSSRAAASAFPYTFPISEWLRGGWRKLLIAKAKPKSATPQDLNVFGILPNSITARTVGGINASNVPLQTLPAQFTIEQCPIVVPNNLYLWFPYFLGFQASKCFRSMFRYAQSQHLHLHLNWNLSVNLLQFQRFP